MKLRPCPFCKSDELIISDNSIDLHADIPGWTTKHKDFIACPCGARGPAGYTEDQAIERWNSYTTGATTTTSELEVTGE